MMLAYQPVRTLATLNMGIHQGQAKRLLPIIDEDNSEKNSDKHLKIDQDVNFKDVSFKYSESLKNVLNKVNLEFKSGQMTALVGHSGAESLPYLILYQDFMSH